MSDISFPSLPEIGECSPPALSPPTKIPNLQFDMSGITDPGGVGKVNQVHTHIFIFNIYGNIFDNIYFLKY